MPYAEDPTDYRRRERPEPHISLRHSGPDGSFEDSQRLQRLPHGQIARVGDSSLEDVAGSVSMADGGMTLIRPGSSWLLMVD
jgi:hypothetical protein